MAFESLSDKLQNTFKKLRGKGVLTEADINDAMREVKLALLEADVNFKVVKEFVSAVKEKAMGQDVLASLTPGQQVIKIVNDELVEMMGGTNSKLTYSPSGFTTLLMVGLQGTGKTTTCGKLAAYLKKTAKSQCWRLAISTDRRRLISSKSSARRSMFRSLPTAATRSRRISRSRPKKKRNAGGMTF